MEDAIKTLYPPHILDHYRNPRNYGSCADHTFVGSSRNPSCGDTISLQGRVQDGVMEEIRFEGSGCMLSQAAASIILEYARGKKVAELLALTREKAHEIVGVPVGATRARCVDLALEVLQQALGANG